MNSYIKTVLLFFKVCAAVCCGCNTIDLHKEEVNEYWHPIQYEQKLNYHKNKLKNICLNILNNKDNEHYEIVFEYNKIKIDIQKIIKDIDDLNIENIIQLQKDIIDYYRNNHNIYFFIY
ncbi:hypothetical protein H7686_0001270 [Candidatus Phytoplasma asiaticum]|uniref:Uncharacterized protein n=1 Tax=Candidatus Phytoplasma asiaticum TaxID=2763338 RepID=A0AAX3BAL4_9MOLU|nr:hypothetical protein ['Parthenium hysterophorus' phyllody phytoplasma]UQV27433.1 hypothetical protein H7686_0001270 ['Parthenium hysterophorus' phyllody phytoplasma]